MRWDKKERGNARIIEQRLSISLVKRGKDYRDGGRLASHNERGVTTSP